LELFFGGIDRLAQFSSKVVVLLVDGGLDLDLTSGDLLDEVLTERE
jgi:hypothetical protein